MELFLIRVFGFLPTVLFGDSAVFDRWIWLKKNLKIGDIRTLDAGCGSGAFAMYAAKTGSDTTGISFEERNNRIASERAEILNLKNVKFIQGDLRKLEDMKKIGEFNQIICFETIEHIKDDRKLLKDFYSVLLSGGILLLTAPYKFYKHLPGDNISDVEDGGHMRWGYTHKEMKNLLNEAGFEVLKEEYVSGIITQILICIERKLSRIIPHSLVWIVLFPFRIFVLFDSFLTKLFNYPYLSVAIIAVKKGR